MAMFYHVSMKYLDCKYYVEVKDKRYKFHPTENNFKRRQITKISENSISSTK